MARAMFSGLPFSVPCSCGMALVYLNDKSVLKGIGHFFGADDKKYAEKVIALLGTDWGSSLLDATRPYIPRIPTQ